MAKLSPVFQDAQFDANGNLLVGGKIYTYVAGSSTPLASYTDEAGGTAQSNPIILNARGEVDDPIWLTERQSYKLRLFDAANNFIREFDDITGVGDNSITLDQWIASGVAPTYVSATQFTLPGDQTSAFQVNRRIKATVTAGTVYGYISVSAYTSLTTVTVVLDSGSLDSGLSAVQLGLTTPDNTSLPQIPDWVKPAMIQDDAILSRMLSDSALGFALINGTLTASVASNALTIAIKTKAGTDPSASDPVLCVFRNVSLTDGTYSVVSITAATSLVVSSGSTLGSISAIAAKFAVMLINNAGTAELAINNISGGVNLDESGVISTTAEGGAGGADSATAIYSTTARTGVPYRVIGLIDITEATAGTWATAPSKLTLVGSGQVAAMSSLGYGQIWQSFTVGSNRVVGTTYYNTTGKPIVVQLNGVYTSANMNINGVSITVGNTTAGTPATFIIPAGASYTHTNAGATSAWYELR